MKISDEKHYINSVYYQIEQTAKFCKYLGNQVFQKLNTPISLDEFSVLDTIKIYGEICQRDLAKLILKDRPTTGRLLNTLEEKGFIKRYNDTKNNRLVRKMSLTDEGEKVLEKSLKVLREYIASLPEFMTEDELNILKNSIRKFRQGLEKEIELNI